MPNNFIFGIPNYFNFTFRARPNAHVPTNGITDVESASTYDGVSIPSALLDKGDVETSSSNGMRNLNSSSSHGMDELGSSTPGACGTLGRLPPEIRTMIYMNVLIYKKYIKRAHEFLGYDLTIQAEDGPHLEVIDAALLRTCRAVYHSAVGVLYGMNTFHFTKPSDVKKFAHFGLGATSFGCYRSFGGPSLAVNNSPFGRFTMVCVLQLKLSHGKDYYGDPKKIWSWWSDVFYSSKEDQLIGFPALEWLSLDFTDWGLTQSYLSKLRVKPFLRVLRPTGGLKHLTLRGVKHEQNIRDFKHGLVKEGGTFRSIQSDMKKGRTTRVTHDDLPQVSMCVRALVEKNTASSAMLSSENAALTDE